MPTGFVSRISTGVSRSQARFAGFIAVSLTLHLVTGFGMGRLDLSARRFGDPAPARTELHATLQPGDRAGPAATQPVDRAAPDRDGTPAPASVESISATGASASDAGLTLPAPDKWYTASEVDVRAEPLTDIRLRYPEDLRDSVTGKVRVRLFIDEGGVVRKLQIAASEPPGLFDEVAKRGWENVRFSPARKNGAAVKSQKLIELAYNPTGIF
jgi:TonB family protein